MGVIQAQLGLHDGRLRGGHVGRRGLGGRHRGDVFLLADRLRVGQRLVAGGLRRGLRLVGLCLGQVGVGAVELRLVWRRVDQEQRLAGLDLRTFGEEPLEHHAVDPGADLRGAQRLDPARQLGLQRDRLLTHRDHADIGRRHAAAARTALAGRLVLAAGGQHRRDRDDQRHQVEHARAGLQARAFRPRRCFCQRGRHHDGIPLAVQISSSDERPGATSPGGRSAAASGKPGPSP